MEKGGEREGGGFKKEGVGGGGGLITSQVCLWLRLLGGDKNNPWDRPQNGRNQKNLLHFIFPSLLAAPVGRPTFIWLQPRRLEYTIAHTHTCTHTRKGCTVLANMLMIFHF